MKLKRIKPGQYRIGFTNWYLLCVYGDNDKPNGLWDLGFDDGRSMNVQDMFSSKKEACAFFQKRILPYGIEKGWPR